MKKQNRYTEYVDDTKVKIDEYNEMDGYSVHDSIDSYFKQQALENAESATVEPLQGEILHATLCKNSNIMLYIKLPSGQRVNVFLSVAEVQALGVPLAISPIYGKTPKGVQVITGYEVCNDKDELKALFYGKKCLVAHISNYVVTEIW